MTQSQLSQRINKVFGWLGLKNAQVLEQLAQGQIVMEIGSYHGRSTVAMAPAAKKVICIDYFRVKAKGRRIPRDDMGKEILLPEKPDTRDIFEKNVKPWRHKIEVHEMNSLDAVKLDWEPVGLLFIDGGHDYATVLSDCGFLKWVSLGGYVVFHDSTRKDVKRVLDQVMVGNPEWREIRNALGMAVYQHIA